jgi:hypothetical protein
MLRAPQLAELGAEFGSVMLTRMHVRYDAEQFRSDLLRETSDRTPVGGRCLIDYPTRPPEARYQRELRERGDKEMASLRRITGWSGEIIRAKAAAR